MRNQDSADLMLTQHVERAEALEWTRATEYDFQRGPLALTIRKMANQIAMGYLPTREGGRWIETLRDANARAITRLNNERDAATTKEQ